MKYIIYIISLLLLSNCTGYQYVSSPQYVPYNEKKGELKTNISYNTFQFGYSITNHLGIFYDHYYRSKTYSSSIMVSSEHDGTISGNHKVKDYNFGVNLFATHNQFVFELLAGAGKGIMSYSNHVDSFEYNNFYLDVNKTNFFIQPEIGYDYSDENINCVFGLFTRFYFTRYRDIKTSIFKSENVSVNPDNQYFIGKKNLDLFFIEPGYIFRVGKKNSIFKWQFLRLLV